MARTAVGDVLPWCLMIIKDRKDSCCWCTNLMSDDNKGREGQLLLMYVGVVVINADPLRREEVHVYQGYLHHIQQTLVFGWTTHFLAWQVRSASLTRCRKTAGGRTCGLIQWSGRWSGTHSWEEAEETIAGGCSTLRWHKAVTAPVIIQAAIDALWHGVRHSWLSSRMTRRARVGSITDRTECIVRLQSPLRPCAACWSLLLVHQDSVLASYSSYRVCIMKAVSDGQSAHIHH